jgi:hypothetical protein
MRGEFLKVKSPELPNSIGTHLLEKDAWCSIHNFMWKVIQGKRVLKHSKLLNVEL